MRKIKVKTLYLIAIVVGGLIGLATKSTYALFTSSTEIDNPICMATNLTSEEEVVDTMDVVVASGEVKEVPITINNTSNSTLNYMVFYNPTSSDIEIGVNMENTDSSNSSGVIRINETKKVYVQIKNNSTSSITITLGVVSNSVSNDMNMVPSGIEGKPAIKIGNNLAEYITNLYTEGTKTTVTLNNVTYNYISSENLMNDRLGSSSTDINAGNIRYYGSSPNNYIYFNCNDYSNQSSTTCDTWRIIGVFDNKVKIMRNSAIGLYSWDADNMNEWSDSDLMKLLNDGYEEESVGGSLYWNAESGSCYNGADTTTTCDFRTMTSIAGLRNESTKNMIAETTYYLKGYSTSNIYVDAMYDKERVSGSVYDSNRSTTWFGKVAVAYPSDYGYAADLNFCKQQLISYKDSTCTSNNWMYNVITNNGTNAGWLLSPASNMASYSWMVNATGISLFFDFSTKYSSGVVPVLSLKSEQKIISGTGNSGDPYQLSGN